jgi:hypothetical protein
MPRILAVDVGDREAHRAPAFRAAHPRALPVSAGGLAGSVWRIQRRDLVGIALV